MRTNFRGKEFERSIKRNLEEAREFQRYVSKSNI